VYVNVHVFIPPHSGSALGVTADGVSGSPQLSVTSGGVGSTASEGQSTVCIPGPGIITVGGSTMYVNTQSYVCPSHAVYVNVHVFGPPHIGSVPGRPADGVSDLPQLSITVGGVGSIASAKQATLSLPPEGIITVGGLIV
jgi:hypothetical protein